MFPCPWSGFHGPSPKSKSWDGAGRGCLPFNGPSPTDRQPPPLPPVASDQRPPLPTAHRPPPTTHSTHRSPGTLHCTTGWYLTQRPPSQPAPLDSRIHHHHQKIHSFAAAAAASLTFAFCNHPLRKSSLTPVIRLFLFLSCDRRCVLLCRRENSRSRRTLPIFNSAHRQTLPDSHRLPRSSAHPPSAAADRNHTTHLVPRPMNQSRSPSTTTPTL